MAPRWGQDIGRSGRVPDVVAQKLAELEARGLARASTASTCAAPSFIVCSARSLAPSAPSSTLKAVLLPAYASIEELAADGGAAIFKELELPLQPLVLPAPPPPQPPPLAAKPAPPPPVERIPVASPHPAPCLATASAPIAQPASTVAPASLQAASEARGSSSSTEANAALLTAAALLPARAHGTLVTGDAGATYAPTAKPALASALPLAFQLLPPGFAATLQYVSVPLQQQQQQQQLPLPTGLNLQGVASQMPQQQPIQAPMPIAMALQQVPAGSVTQSVAPSVSASGAPPPAAAPNISGPGAPSKPLLPPPGFLGAASAEAASAGGSGAADAAIPAAPAAAANATAQALASTQTSDVVPITPKPAPTSPTPFSARSSNGAAMLAPPAGLEQRTAPLAPPTPPPAGVSASPQGGAPPAPPPGFGLPTAAPAQRTAAAPPDSNPVAIAVGQPPDDGLRAALAADAELACLAAEQAAMSSGVAAAAAVTVAAPQRLTPPGPAWFLQGQKGYKVQALLRRAVTQLFAKQPELFATVFGFGLDWWLHARGAPLGEDDLLFSMAWGDCVSLSLRATIKGASWFAPALATNAPLSCFLQRRITGNAIVLRLRLEEGGAALLPPPAPPSGEDSNMTTGGLGPVAGDLICGGLPALSAGHVRSMLLASSALQQHLADCRSQWLAIGTDQERQFGWLARLPRAPLTPVGTPDAVAALPQVVAAAGLPPLPSAPAGATAAVSKYADVPRDWRPLLPLLRCVRCTSPRCFQGGMVAVGRQGRSRRPCPFGHVFRPLPLPGDSAAARSEVFVHTAARLRVGAAAGGSVQPLQPRTCNALSLLVSDDDLRSPAIDRVLAQACSANDARSSAKQQSSAAAVGAGGEDQTAAAAASPLPAPILLFYYGYCNKGASCAMCHSSHELAVAELLQLAGQQSGSSRKGDSRRLWFEALLDLQEEAGDEEGQGVEHSDSEDGAEDQSGRPEPYEAQDEGEQGDNAYAAGSGQGAQQWQGCQPPPPGWDMRSVPSSRSAGATSRQANAGNWGPMGGGGRASRDNGHGTGWQGGRAMVRQAPPPPPQRQPPAGDANGSGSGSASLQMALRGEWPSYARTGTEQAGAAQAPLLQHPTADGMARSSSGPGGTAVAAAHAAAAGLERAAPGPSALPRAAGGTEGSGAKKGAYVPPQRRSGANAAAGAAAGDPEAAQAAGGSASAGAGDGDDAGASAGASAAPGSSGPAAPAAASSGWSGAGSSSTWDALAREGAPLGTASPQSVQQQDASIGAAPPQPGLGMPMLAAAPPTPAAAAYNFSCGAAAAARGEAAAVAAAAAVAREDVDEADALLLLLRGVEELATGAAAPAPCPVPLAPSLPSAQQPAVQHNATRHSHPASSTAAYATSSSTRANCADAPWAPNGTQSWPVPQPLPLPQQQQPQGPSYGPHHMQPQHYALPVGPGGLRGAGALPHMPWPMPVPMPPLQWHHQEQPLDAFRTGHLPAALQLPSQQQATPAAAAALPGWLVVPGPGQPGQQPLLLPIPQPVPVPGPQQALPVPQPLPSHMPFEGAGSGLDFGGQPASWDFGAAAAYNTAQFGMWPQPPASGGVGLDTYVDIGRIQNWADDDA